MLSFKTLERRALKLWVASYLLLFGRTWSDNIKRERVRRHSYVRMGVRPDSDEQHFDRTRLMIPIIFDAFSSLVCFPIIAEEQSRNLSHPFDSDSILPRGG